MTLSSLLGIGRNALGAAARGSSIVSQNVSNAATPGYSRRVATLEPIPLDQAGGVRVTGSNRVQDAYLERRLLGARAFAGESDARVRTLTVLDTALADGPGSVGDALDAFDAALADLTAHPSEQGARTVVLDRAGQLGDAFARAAGELTQARVDANAHITDAVSQVNEKLGEIGDLAGKITAARNLSQETGDLEDRRDQLLREVADLVPVSTLLHGDGRITVQLAGSRTLVDPDGHVHALLAQTEPTSGDVRVYRQTAGATEDITALITSGAIGGTIAARDGALAQARGALDQLAFDVATAYNTQHAAGVGLDGATGRNLFEVPAGVAGAAFGMGISSDVAGQPARLAAATSATSLPGDNRNALLLLGLRDQPIATSGTRTAGQALADLVAGAGSALRRDLDAHDHAGASVAQVESLRQAVSGVSTDEEMMQLMQFQRAYQAALRVVETADSMLQDLLGLRR